MIQSKLGLKAFGLCVLMVGLMAVSANSALAGAWDVEGTATLPAQVQIKDLEGLGSPSVKDGTLLAQLNASTHVAFTCTAMELVGANLEAGGSVTNGFAAKFTGCVTFLNGALAKNCEAKSSGQPNGTIQTVALKGLLQLVSGAKVTIIEAKTGDEFVDIDVGPKCSFGEEVPVLCNKFAVKDAGLETSSLDHLISEEPTNSKCTALGKPAVIIGSALVKLVGGSDEDQQWRGLAL
jgi:hypothetical protein